MNRRQALRAATVSLVLVGAGALLYLFLTTLPPNAKARAAIPRFDLADLEVNQYREVADPRNGERTLILRLDQELLVFTVPYLDGAYQMPDISWDRAVIPCYDFGPDHENGRLLDQGTIRCRDKANVLSRELRWDYHGRNLGESTEDLPEGRYRLDDTHIVIGPGS